MHRVVVPALGQVLFAVGLGYAGMAGISILANTLGKPFGFDARETTFFLSMGIGTVLAAWVVDGRGLGGSLALSWPTDRRTVIWFADVLLLVLAAEAIAAVSGFLGSIEDLKAMSSSERSWLGFLNAVLLAPVVEEVLFRGLLFTRLRQRFSTWPVLAVVTLAFGLLHAENGLLHVVSVLPAGAFLGFAREYSGGIGLPIVLHACMNLAIVAAGTLL
ncbi:CAAX protease self-immunity [Bosea sp. 62]|uniref:CPBP family intramembrane glutamic endopeptidase n=1 Tax=unclassified Bosea (in: a-proteobacteria) TaxID=2653178 RepID=UPI0012562A7B|nr:MULTISPECIES: CPBP family intramembrane glutamic endopeptidase [unclassified Bosea (in: a-proteobacteria)]CAD5246723.1 CAAX protease self-immunity [Bosea sp. 21B]CAD5247134.1 CAAX protease self-immunity [Bosea sp. 7B]CAD5269271.1 CAAX protease self-immunity [Bosea sp. 46]VVT50677.1 CAAX protease self-immunity [Bosea sp. EC-HK365B]VXA97938.1 CAAX protease self-immunity [Bosea sp. 127]